MKKFLLLLCPLFLIIAFTSACFGGSPTSVDPLSLNDKLPTKSNTKSLIVYYSLSGNTEIVANELQQITQADMVRIETVTPYPEDFHAVVEQARKERDSGYLPPIKPILNNLDDYDVIYLGYPIWGNTLPQPMATFLSQNNLAGKTIIPFCTHDGYGVGRSFEAIASYCPDAQILNGFDLLGANAQSSRAPLMDWLKKLPLGASLANVTSRNENMSMVITIGEAKLTGVLYDTPTAKEFRSRLPQVISMGAYGGREYYGSIQDPIQTNEEGQLRFEDGDITYCPQNNTIAIFFAQTSRPNLTMKVIPIGKVTSDLSVFESMDSSIQVAFNL